MEGGRGGSEVFLSSHRCPEVDLLPRRHSDAHVFPPRSLAPQRKLPEVGGTGEEDEEEEEEEEGDGEEGSESDWSEEDLSLHFSPSVIIQSDDDESDPEISCIDVTVETQERSGQKMVPKRQIHLKKKETIISDQPPLTKAPAEGGGAKHATLANEQCPTVKPRPDVLLRQHSVPTSFHTDVDSCRVYRGLVSGAQQGFQVVGNSPRRLQKSFSLDETKTKMASCIITNILSKKMKVEQMKSNTPRTKEEEEEPPPQKGGGASGALKTPVHVVRDIKSCVKNTYDDKTPSFKLIGQDSPPPTYQQAVGVKGQNKMNASRGRVAKFAASFGQSRPKHQDGVRERRDSEPIIRRSHFDDVTPQDTPPHVTAAVHQSERDKGARHLGPSHPCVFAPPTFPGHPKVNYMPRPQASEQPDRLRKARPPQPTRTTATPPTHAHYGNTDSPPAPPPRDSAETPPTQNHIPNPPVLCGVQGFVPAPAGQDCAFDLSGAALPPGSFLRGPAPCQVVYEPMSGRCYYVDTPPQPQLKMLLDPETGQFIQVLINPTHSVISHAPTVINPAPTVLQPAAPNPPFLSVMQLQPMAMYSAPCLPFTVFAPSGNFTHSAP